MKVTLAQALKLKNRTVAAINRAKEILTRENSRDAKSASKVDCTVVYADMLRHTEALIVIKTALAKANVGIYAQLAEMEEKKSFITYLRTLTVTEGEVKAPRFHQEADATTFVAYINAAKRDELIATAEARIAVLQDEVDTFNASHRVDVA